MFGDSILVLVAGIYDGVETILPISLLSGKERLVSCCAFVAVLYL